MNEALPGEIPAPDAPVTEVTSAESSPAPESAVDAPTADPGSSEEAALKTATQKRIDKLTWEKGERDREIAYWRSLAMEKQQQAAPEQEKRFDVLTPPTLEQHQYDEAKYQAAYTEYAKAIARSEVQEALRQSREQEQAEGRAKSFKTREAEFIAKTPDYQEKVYDKSLQVSPSMVSLIAESDIGPQLAYHLASNPQIAAELARFPQIEDKYGNKIPHPVVAREMGKLEAKLSIAPPAPPPVSKAPAPPPKIDAVEPEVAKDPSNMTDKEFATWRRRQIAQRRNK